MVRGIKEGHDVSCHYDSLPWQRAIRRSLAPDRDNQATGLPSAALRAGGMTPRALCMIM